MGRIDVSAIGDRFDLPCGCVTGTVEQDGERIFIFQPCSLDCDAYAFALAQSREQGKPARLQYHPEGPPL